MILTYLVKVVALICILFLALCVSNLYKIFNEITDAEDYWEVKNASGWVAFGMLWEVVFMVILAIKIIVG